MNEYEIVVTALTIGAAIPMILYGVYWIALDQAKRYSNKQTQEVKNYVRDNFERK